MREPDTNAEPDMLEWLVGVIQRLDGQLRADVLYCRLHEPEHSQRWDRHAVSDKVRHKLPLRCSSADSSSSMTNGCKGVL